jgi:quercetin dioxygenase-like cupin family protein
MSIPHATPGETISVRPLGAILTTTKTTTLAKSDELEIIRLVVPAGKEITKHKAPGAITVQCLEGRISFTAMNGTQEMEAGDLLYLTAGEPHAVKAIETSSILLTMFLPQSKSPQRPDMVQEASEESFPASDPPARTGITRP